MNLNPYKYMTKAEFLTLSQEIDLERAEAERIAETDYERSQQMILLSCMKELRLIGRTLDRNRHLAWRKGFAAAGGVLEPLPEPSDEGGSEILPNEAFAQCLEEVAVSVRNGSVHLWNNPRKPNTPGFTVEGQELHALYAFFNVGFVPDAAPKQSPN
jgi:hypothetical protein